MDLSTTTAATEVSAPLLLRSLGAHLESGHGLVALDPVDRILVASEAARSLLDLPEGCEGHRLAELGADYRLLRVLDASRHAEAAVEREIADPGRVVVVRAFPVPHKRVSAMILVRDETRLRRLERIRRDFVTNVSHELRTPITAIRLLVETLQKGALERPDVAGTFVQRIGLEIGHMEQMVEELLELSMIESGGRPLTFETVPVSELLGTIDRLLPLAEERHQAVSVEVAPDTPSLRGDPRRLGQVLRNLVHNAIKFTPREGHITVTARPLGDGSRVQLTVRDTGIGIRPEDMPRIFERFWKADSSRQRDGEGSGLGLAIARHVVEAHGGSIRVESEPKHGATFFVDLPAAMGPELVELPPALAAEDAAPSPPLNL
ncbi:MAG TPA: ATP-binding protein [Candidatus Binatia bacterium]|nr:ATP-binding protein [Candidatus Binatia bacterium]